MEIQFTRGGQPDGGKISNFLLEKVSLLKCIELFKIVCFLIHADKYIQCNRLLIIC